MSANTRINGLLDLSAALADNLALSAKGQSIRDQIIANTDQRNQRLIRELESSASSNLHEQTMARVINEENNILKKKKEKLQDEVVELKEAIKERDRLILEWMSGNLAYKNLAIKYGMALKKTKNEFNEDIATSLIIEVEKNPQVPLTKTNMYVAYAPLSKKN